MNTKTNRILILVVLVTLVSALMVGGTANAQEGSNGSEGDYQVCRFFVNAMTGTLSQVCYPDQDNDEIEDYRDACPTAWGEWWNDGCPTVDGEATPDA